jgi:hypothetical protein
LNQRLDIEGDVKMEEFDRNSDNSKDGNEQYGIS